MKRLVLAAALGISLFCNGQQTEKKFQMGIGVVGGSLTSSYQGKTSFSATFGIGPTLQGEYRFAPHFSAFASGNYNLIFGIGDYLETLNFASALAGPRIYPSKAFFLGIGLGYGVIFAKGNSLSGFSYEPQVGLNLKRSQLVLCYNAISVFPSASVANLNIEYIFKL
jgi:hypothetical protein